MSSSAIKKSATTNTIKPTISPVDIPSLPSSESGSGAGVGTGCWAGSSSGIGLGVGRGAGVWEGATSAPGPGIPSWASGDGATTGSGAEEDATKITSLLPKADAEAEELKPATTTVYSPSAISPGSSTRSVSVLYSPALATPSAIVNAISVRFEPTAIRWRSTREKNTSEDISHTMFAVCSSTAGIRLPATHVSPPEGSVTITGTTEAGGGDSSDVTMNDTL
mmetsp:Transcript_8302/g.30636  ORF Transcript_8302/g.30636 Transcript_8302/m.30636 type:complete len:222 (-) Transcript_8302:1671-2336(-)